VIFLKSYTYASAKIGEKAITSQSTTTLITITTANASNGMISHAHTKIFIIISIATSPLFPKLVVAGRFDTAKIDPYKVNSGHELFAACLEISLKVLHAKVHDIALIQVDFASSRCTH
jgi:hypothetical protein